MPGPVIKTCWFLNLLLWLLLGPGGLPEEHSRDLRWILRRPQGPRQKHKDHYLLQYPLEEPLFVTGRRQRGQVLAAKVCHNSICHLRHAVGDALRHVDLNFWPGRDKHHPAQDPAQTNRPKTRPKPAPNRPKLTQRLRARDGPNLPKSAQDPPKLTQPFSKLADLPSGDTGQSAGPMHGGFNSPPFKT